MENELKLEPVVIGDDAEVFAAGVMSHRGSTMNINASEVTRIDTPCLEVLIAAQKLWAEDNCTLGYSAISEPFETALTTLGLDKTMLETGDS